MKPRIAIALLAVLIWAGCGGTQSPTDPVERVRRAGKLVIAYADEEPFGYLDPSSGKVTGEAPEIARIMAARLGVDELESVQTEWKSLIPGLKAGRFDCIAAGMYVTPERAANVAFSNPTYRIGEAFLVTAANPKELHAYEDLLGHPDAKLGVVRGTVERGYARKLGIPDERVVVYPDNNAAVAGLQAGQIDAFAGTSLTVQTLVDKLGPKAGLARAEPFEQPIIDGKPAVGYGAFAFRKADAALRDAFNAELEAFLGTPEHLALVKPFGFTKSELPGVTTEAILRQSEPEAAE